MCVFSSMPTVTAMSCNVESGGDVTVDLGKDIRRTSSAFSLKTIKCGDSSKGMALFRFRGTHSRLLPIVHLP